MMRRMKKTMHLNEFEALDDLDCFSFGRDYFSNSNRRLQWLRLDSNEDSILLLSRQIIYIDSFHDREGDFDWSTSYVRKFFNSEFMHMCFRDNESRGIRITDLHNEKENLFCVSGGPDTRDYVFLLSFEQFQKYQEDIPGSLSIPLHLMNGTAKNDYFIPDTEQQKQRRLYYESIDYDSVEEVNNTKDEDVPVTSVSSFYSNLGWWLRTPGIDSREYMFVDRYNHVCEKGINGILGVQGYRPAMWVSKSALARFGDVA